jgi:hypothetical protein
MLGEDTVMKTILIVVALVVLALPATAQLDPVVEWVFDSEQIISIPVVADIDDDGVPEVVINLTQMDGGGWTSGNIAILDGQTGLEVLRIPHDPAADQFGSHGRSTIAVGDVSGDGLPDIIYATRTVSGDQSLIVAVDAGGTLLWRSHATGGADYLFTVVNAAITLANFDDDASAEIVIGATLLDNDGLVVWDQDGGGQGSTYGSNNGYIGGISAVADINEDGLPEIISGRHAWQVDWQPGPTVNVTSFWSSGADGYPAIADLDLDGVPEIVMVASSELTIREGSSGSILAGPVVLAGGVGTNRGGPATIADFDGDGNPDIGVAGDGAFTVYEFDPSGKSAAAALTVKWSATIQDLSSGVAGASAYDFDGDGRAEALFADECYLRVYAGADGSVLLEMPNSSATNHEFPVVADVDGDGDAELLVVASAQAGCVDPERHGLYIYGDAAGEWAPTRKLWTQHTYHVTNATEEGNVPIVESNNWHDPALNNYRQSSPEPVSDPTALHVDPSPDSLHAGWILTGPDAFVLSAAGDTTLYDLTPGDYGIVWSDIQGWITPSPETGTLDPGVTVTFFGIYAPFEGPVITAVEDVASDQGRHVRLVWDRSFHDDPLEPIVVTGYEVYRRQDGVKDEGWDYVATVPAHGVPVYQVVAPTVCDSTVSSGMCWSVFFLRADTNDPYVFFDSEPDSGYSVDNLSPSIPANLLLAGGELSWDECPDGDFDYFTVYGSSSPDLAGASLLDHTTGTSMTVAGSGHAYLLVTATDFSGNEGEPAVADGATGVGGTPVAFRLLGAVPNPFNPKTTICYELPDERMLDLRIYDVSGRLVRELLGGALIPAGRHGAEWDGRDESGRSVSAGVYFYRLSTGAESDFGRMVLVR